MPPAWNCKFHHYCYSHQAFPAQISYAILFPKLPDSRFEHFIPIDNDNNMEPKLFFITTRCTAGIVPEEKCHFCHWISLRFECGEYWAKCSTMFCSRSVVQNWLLVANRINSEIQFATINMRLLTMYHLITNQRSNRHSFRSLELQIISRHLNMLDFAHRQYHLC